MYFYQTSNFIIIHIPLLSSEMFAKKNKPSPSNPINLPLQLRTIILAGNALKKWTKQAKNTKQRVHILKEWIST